MGQVWKLGLYKILRPIFNFFDQNTLLRSFAKTFVYSKELYTDFFVLSIFLALQNFTALGVALYWQIKYEYLPWWLVFAYYCQWVGLGGRGMGGAYTLSHKEGHHRGGGLYKNWIASSFGNVWENWMGFLYGIVPYNFSTSHVFLHHKLNGGKGDAMYQWDLDRSSWSDLMLFQYRVMVYMTGWSSLETFRALADSNTVMAKNYKMLLKGMVMYWIVCPIASLSLLIGVAGCSVISSLKFMFYIWFEPMCGMAFFLALINFAFHAFIELDENGRHVACVNSTVIFDGDDDYWGEDDHMAHHYYTNVSHRDLPAHQQTQHEEWKKFTASCFKKLSIVELAIFILLKEWKRLATHHFVDFSGKLSVDEIAHLLEVRAKRKEMDYETYEFDYLPNLKANAMDLVNDGTCRNVGEALKHLAHTSTPLMEGDVAQTSSKKKQH
uniref:Fatty acid desaturase domain-containing protein n=1 Tax=Hanusia phi TaxID=3032 RepID=A0A7S0E067_9CRYP